MCEYQYQPGEVALLAQLFRRTTCKLSNRRDQWADFGDRNAKASCTGDMLLGWRGVVQADAGFALELPHRALQHAAPSALDHGGAQSGKVKRGVDAGII